MLASFDDFEVRIGHFEISWVTLKLTLSFISKVGLFEVAFAILGNFEVMLTKITILRLGSTPFRLNRQISKECKDKIDIIDYFEVIIENNFVRPSKL